MHHRNGRVAKISEAIHIVLHGNFCGQKLMFDEGYITMLVEFYRVTKKIKLT